MLVLTGASGHFCAGADLQGVEDASFATLLQGVLDRLVEVSFPTMAAIEGAALGAGTQLAVACDLRVATAGASFGIPAAKLGLMVTHWTVQRVATLLGPSTARAVLLAAEVVDGEQALRLGLVNRGRPAGGAGLGGADRHPGTAHHHGHKLMLNKLEAPPVAMTTSPWRSPGREADFAEGLDAFGQDPDLQRSYCPGAGARSSQRRATMDRHAHGYGVRSATASPGWAVRPRPCGEHVGAAASG